MFFVISSGGRNGPRIVMWAGTPTRADQSRAERIFATSTPANDATAITVVMRVEDGIHSERQPILWRLDADEECHLQPLPIAIDIGEADLAQPAKLRLHVG